MDDQHVNETTPGRKPDLGGLPVDFGREPDRQGLNFLRIRLNNPELFRVVYHQNQDNPIL